jgi:tripartite-type tricarboxylate transporter receptor subunit TctC
MTQYHRRATRARSLGSRIASFISLGYVLLAAMFLPAAAQTYPSRPIEIVVPVTAGGGTDVVGRAFAEAARKYLPQQPLTVINKPGASGAIGMGDVASSKPDGYKLAILISELTIVPHINNVKFSIDDFTPIARLNADPAAITVSANAPWNTIGEFLAYARKNPGEVKLGNGGQGSIWHLAAASLEDRAQVKFNNVPFSGSAPAVISLLGGHIDALAVSPGEVSQHVAAGKLKTLTIMSDQRWGGVFEKVPTLKESGIDLKVEVWRGLAAPKNTPSEVIDLLRDVSRQAANDPAFREILAKANLGWAYADAAVFRTTMERDNASFKQLIPKLGLKN